MKAWPKVALGDIAPIVRRPVAVLPGGLYHELGVRSFGKGTFHKPALTGTDVGSKRLFRIEPGDLIFSNVFAWEGAIAVATRDDKNRVGSHRFITCVVDPARVNATYLKLYLTTAPEGREQIMKASPGGAGRNRTLGIKKLGLIEVPIPPLPEQKSLVTRLDALAEKTRQVEAHLAAAERDAERAVLALHYQLAGDRKVTLSDVVELHEEPVPIVLGETYPQIGVRSFGAGLFAKPATAAHETSYRAFNRLYTDAIVLSQVKGWEGAIALAPQELAGMFASPEYRTFRCLPGEASPGYLGEIMKTPWFWSLLQEATRGVGARRERTRPEQFLKVRLPMPTFEKQQAAAAVFSRLAALKAKHATIRAANAALLPATLERVFSGGD